MYTKTKRKNKTKYARRLTTQYTKGEGKAT